MGCACMKMSPQLGDLGISGILKGRSACAEIQLPLRRYGGLTGSCLTCSTASALASHPTIFLAPTQGHRSPVALRNPESWGLYSEVWCYPVTPHYELICSCLTRNLLAAALACTTLFDLRHLFHLWPSLAWSSLSSAWPEKVTTLQSTMEKYVIFCLGQKVVLMWARTLKLPLFKRINFVSFRHLLPLSISYPGTFSADTETHTFPLMPSQSSVTFD